MDTAAAANQSAAPQTIDWLVHLFQHAPTAVAWLEGPQHIFRYVNPAYLLLVGPRDLWGRSVSEALPEVVEQGFVDLLDKAYASRTAHIGSGASVQLQRAAGAPVQTRVVDFVFQPAQPPGAAIPGILVQAQDVTDRIEAEAALRESEAKFRAITNSVDQMIWSTLPDGYHDFYNDRWYEYTGVPHGSTDGAQWSGMFHPDDQQRAWAVWRHSLASGVPYHIEYRLRHRSGEYRWVLGRAQAMRDDAGNIVRWFGTCTDIQELVDAREQLRHARQELEAQVRQRSLELAESQARLHQAQKMEAIGQLTGGIAHDFNNMLQSISGGVEMARRLIAAGRSSEAGRFLDMASSGVGRAAAMTQRLLSFSRRQPLSPQPVEINTLVLSLRDLLLRTMGENIQVQFELSPEVGWALCDPPQLESALLNLAINARDAMPEGGVLKVRTSRCTLSAPIEHERETIAAGEYVEVSVQDSGHGMPPEVAARAFEPFFTTKAAGQGTGLGLAMVYGFVRQSNGMAMIHSSPGGGTTITLRLPQSAALAPVEAAEPQSLGSAEIPLGTRVLLVEDDLAVCALLEGSLKEIGFVVDVKHSSSQAVQALQEEVAPDLLVIDLGLPGGMNGGQVAEFARSRWPQLKVLLVTGYLHQAHQRFDSDWEVLSKPVRIDDFLRRVQELTASRRSS